MAGRVISELIQHIEARQNFVLSGGAGSGKTHSLVEVLNYIFSNHPQSKVACITFTNVAADEIKKRTPYKNLWVSTIHEFLWDNIKGFQKNLKTSLIKLLADENIDDRLKIKCPDDLTIETLRDIGQIQYKEFYVLEEGIISHDHVLKLAHHMFVTYPLLRKILSDKFDYIFIDEYQDTEKIVIEIFLEHLSENEKPIVGLFGDSMQSIYDNRVGNLYSYVTDGSVKEVVKQDNNRCSISVINLLNRIRDDIKQAPTNNNVQGSARFIFSCSGNLSMTGLQSLEIFNNWDFEQNGETKQLFLTHKLIANELRFPTLINLYSNNDRLLKPENHDPLIEHLYRIHELLQAYNDRKFNFFINKTDYVFSRAEDKKRLNESIKRLQEAQEKTIKDVLTIAAEIQLVEESNRFKKFKVNQEKQDHLEAVLSVSYREFTSVFSYINQFTPFSTQHNIKGDEFKNVFVALDNGNWSKYNFKYLFEGTGSESVRERTKKLFYVCCSRAKENLVVYYSKPSDASIQQAKEWFGEENVIEVGLS